MEVEHLDRWSKYDSSGIEKEEEERRKKELLEFSLNFGTMWRELSFSVYFKNWYTNLYTSTFSSYLGKQSLQLSYSRIQIKTVVDFQLHKVSMNYQVVYGITGYSISFK